MLSTIDHLLFFAAGGPRVQCFAFDSKENYTYARSVIFT